ncbi:MAG: hypothetical protein ACK4GM_06255 [Tabrizicola sp.]
MTQVRRFGRNALAALLCLSLAIWSVAPGTGHVPSILEVIADHAEMIAEHGHSHGMEEDLLWALHGHSHDVADHDHSQALLAFAAGSHPIFGYRDDFRLHPSTGGPHRIYMIERPPRA